MSYVNQNGERLVEINTGQVLSGDYYAAKNEYPRLVSDEFIGLDVVKLTDKQKITIYRKSPAPLLATRILWRDEVALRIYLTNKVSVTKAYEDADLFISNR